MRGAYFEEVVVGDVHETPGLTITSAHVALYLGITRELAADDSAVPDLLPLCFTTGLGWRVAKAPPVVLAFMGFDWEVLRSVHVGDTIMARARFMTKRPMRDAGVLIEEREIVDQRGEVVQRGRLTYLVAKRAKETSP
jgi:hypothetical protein